MSRIVRVGIILAFVMAVLSVATSLILAVKEVKYREVLQQNDTTLKQNQSAQANYQNKIKEFDKVKAEKEQLARKAAEVEERLSETTDRIAQLQQTLEEREQKVNELKEEKEQLQAVQGDTDVNGMIEKIGTLEQELARAQQAGQTQNSEQAINAKLKELTEALKEKNDLLEDSKKRETDLENIAESLKSQIEQLKDIHQAKREPSYRVEAPVEVVNREMKFIVFSLGENDGLNVGDMVSIYRKGDLLGSVYVDEVFQNMGSATLSDELLKFDVREGDIVRK